MARQRYSKREAMNRILRSIEGENMVSDAPNTLSGEILSEDEAASDIAELLNGSLPNESGIIPVGIRTRPTMYSDSKFFYVIPDHPQASDSNSGENPAFPLATVQQAVTNSRAYRGDVIYVTSSDSWQYGAQTEAGVRECVVIPADKGGIAIVGVNHGALGTYWRPTGTSGWCITVNALDVTIDGFTFWAGALVTSGNGISCVWASPATYGENTVIQNCTFASDIVTGIQLEYAWFCDIIGNHFQENSGYGIAVSASGSGASYLKIIGNWFHNVLGSAMFLNATDKSLIKQNYIYNATAQATGTCTDMGIITTAGEENIVADNYFSIVQAKWDEFNTGDDTDAWINNHCINGDTTTNPT